MKTRLLTIAFFASALMWFSGCAKPDPDPDPQPNDSTGTEEVEVPKFTISPNSKAEFSKGNLQYNPYLNTYRFAETQYQTMKEENNYVFDAFNGWMDLFGWGTGDNPINYSTNNADYPTFNDWGNYMEESGWRTLTASEWEYVLKRRPNASNLLACGTIEDAMGLILLPDDYEGVINHTMNSFEDNIFTEDSWKEMEDKGAIFLPINGMRYGSFVSGYADFGYYWTSTPNDTESANSFCIQSGKVNQYNTSKYVGQAVRLVRVK